ncbi:hypothetical protein HU200_040854 [Digitaria exilis]|uniref:MADS-box domain-containing protein n=1 Tax=Digitaria exilis TaxID=1010633 RepID=A0A835EFW1_9POAL|nr:hypothetical protein HU200_040854 [Digitaria exilis]
MVRGKQPKGKQKIEIKPIESEEARQVCFSKRRQGLFKKASELSILCGAMVGTIVFSTIGRTFSFGHPSIDEVVNRFLNPVSPDDPASAGPSHDNAGSVAELNREYSELEQSLDSEKKKKKRLQEATEKEMGEHMMQWLNASILELGLDELLEFQKKVEQIHEIVKDKVKKVLVEGGQILVPLPEAPMETASTSWSANPVVPAAPSSSIAFIDAIQVDDPLLSGGIDGVAGLGNFPNNQNHG